MGVRQKGFMVGIELVQDKQSKKPFPLEQMMGARVVLEARKRGVIIRPLGDIIVIMPPLSISLDHLEELVEVILHSIKEVTSYVES